jgi:HSP20 family protein
MSAKSRDPFFAMRQEMEELFSKLWDGNRENWLSPTFSPSADLTEAEKAFELKLDLPGLTPKDIDVQVHGNTVTVSGHRREEKEEKEKSFHRLERYSGAFSRTFSLPCEVNESEVAAEYAHGVLTVKLPKCEKATPKKVSVKG